MSEKEDIMKKLKEKGIEFNPNSRVETLKKLLDEKPAEELKETPSETKQDALSQIMGALEGINTRLSALERKDKGDGFKDEAKSEDIAKAAITREGVDAKIVSIVDETLGTDFGVDVSEFGDRPGFLFTVVVPERLSDNVQDSRPVRDPETGKYKTDANGNVLFENYIPEDRRSCAIGSTQSYEAIRKHCDRVRSYIVAYYQKMQKPLPEFKVK